MKDLYWLAGILDGEGCFTLVQRAGAANRGKFGDAFDGKSPTFAPRVQVGNTDMELLKKVSEILCEYGIKFYWQLHSVNKRFPEGKGFVTLNVEGYASYMKLHALVSDKLESGQRKKQAKIIAEYVTRRQQELKEGNGRADYVYGKRCFHEVSNLTRSQISPSTTKRVASSPLSW